METKPARTREKTEEVRAEPTRTIVGWQGIRCALPPDWNLVGFSMDRDNGYLRLDSPGSGAMAVEIRYLNAAKQARGGPTLYTLLAPKFRKLLRRPEPPVPKPDLRANLEKILKETAKRTRKAKAAFESALRPEKVEGENGERAAINFSWTGTGRAQGKIWYCETCRRVVVAQVIGQSKDQQEIASIASQLFGSLHDHAENGYDLWALYDLKVEVPEDFHLEEQKLMSGYLRLVFGRRGEKIIVDRWGLANMALKKFTPAEWLANNAAVSLKGMQEDEAEAGNGHMAHRFSGALPLLGRLRALRDLRVSFRRFPTRYQGGIWECAESNKLFAVQTLAGKKTEGLWSEVAQRCECH